MTDLSPAAQDILAAYDNSPFEYDTGDLTACAAVLRAANEHLSMYSPYTGCDEDEGVAWACKELATIAAELEVQ
jgi:hypothetical protein